MSYNVTGVFNVKYWIFILWLKSDASIRFSNRRKLCLKYPSKRCLNRREFDTLRVSVWNMQYLRFSQTMITQLLLLTAALLHNLRCLRDQRATVILMMIYQSLHFSGEFCYDKRVEVIPVNTTTHVWVPETTTESCWFCLSWEHPFQRVVTKRRLKPVITVENITKTTLGGWSVLNISLFFFPK